MLPAHLIADNGLKIIEENSELVTTIRGHVADLDIEGSYPNNECVMNVSKETTKRELICIEGVPEELVRREGINLSAGHVNAVEICCNLFGMPNLDSLLQEFNNDLNQTKYVVCTI